MNERNLLAVSIKHTEYRWRFGMPCVLWGRRTKDDEKRSFGGYTLYPNNAEIYSLTEWQKSEYGNGGICKVDEPVKMEIGFARSGINSIQYLSDMRITSLIVGLPD